MMNHDKLKAAIESKKISSMSDHELTSCIKTAWDKERTGKPPLQEDIEMAIAYLREYHHYKGFKEIWLAVELNVFNQLESSVKSFQQFTVKYLSQLMGEYEKVRQQYFKELNKAKPENQTIPTISGGEMYKATIDFIGKHGCWPMIWPWWIVYDFLISTGKFDPEKYDNELKFVTSTEKMFRSESRKDFLTRMADVAKKRICKKVISMGKDIPEMEDFKVNVI